MSPRAIANVRTSFMAVASRLDEVVDHFYIALFAAHPRVRALFPADMARQKEHVRAALAVLFRNIDNLEALEGPLLEMGARHVGYGALPDHYPPVRDALLSAVRTVMGEAWNERLEQDWLATLNKVCEMMLRGASAAALAVAQSMRMGATNPGHPGGARPTPGANGTGKP